MAKNLDSDSGGRDHGAIRGARIPRIMRAFSFGETMRVILCLGSRPLSASIAMTLRSTDPVIAIPTNRSIEPPPAPENVSICGDPLVLSASTIVPPGAIKCGLSFSAAILSAKLESFAKVALSASTSITLCRRRYILRANVVTRDTSSISTTSADHATRAMRTRPRSSSAAYGGSLPLKGITSKRGRGSVFCGWDRPRPFRSHSRIPAAKDFS